MLVEDSVRYGEDIIEYLKAEGVNLKAVDVAICAPYIHMSALKVIFLLRNVKVGAQNMHFEESGAYTGEISPAMLKDLGIECVIIGHSERRQYCGETSEACAKKVKAAVQHGIRPILCVGESLAEREAGNHENAVGDMLLASLNGVTAEEMISTVIAYEPVWAIGTGLTATAEQANEMASFIRACVAEKYGEEVAEQIIIQYGGSVNAENAAELMSMSDIDGALVGTAGLNAKNFAKLISNAVNQ